MGLRELLFGGRGDASAQQLKREEERRKAEEAAAAQAAKEEAERQKARDAVSRITFKKGGAVRSRDGVASKGKTKGRYI